MLDGREWPEDIFFEQAMTHFNEGIKLLESGNYEDALISLQHAQETHGEPSGAIQTWIGTAFSTLGQHETAIKHYTNAVEIRDTSYHRVSRSFEYAFSGQCEEAMTDAEIALTMNAYSEPGYHTGVEAHSILAACLINHDETRALTHREQAISLARAHGYAQEDIAFIETITSK